MKTLIVESPTISCPECGVAIEVNTSPSKAKNNPIYCPECQSALRLESPEGEYLNLWWAALDTEVSQGIADLFSQHRFPDRATSDRWHRFEKEYPAEVIYRAAKVLYDKLTSKNVHWSSGCWSGIIASVERKIAPAQSDKPIVPIQFKIKES